MITAEQKELIRMLEWEINNIETALRKNKVEKYMIPLMKRRIDVKKIMINDIKQYNK